MPDEETAGPRCSRDLAARGVLGNNGIGILTPEPTGGIIWNANPGAITLRATMRRKPAHVGRQFEGVNAFERKIPAMTKLLDLNGSGTPREATADYPRGGAQLHSHARRPRPGGHVTPDSCSFTLDRRIKPEENFEEEKRRLLDALEGFEVEILQEGAGTTTGGKPLGVALSRHATAVTGKALAVEMSPGLLETRFYAAHDIPAFVYGLGLLTAPQEIGERILDRRRKFNAR